MENRQKVYCTFYPDVPRYAVRFLDTAELQQLAVEVGEVLKNKMGDDAYAKRLGECQKTVMSRTAMRKRKHAEEAVTDPQTAALKKQRRQMAKVTAKKRRIALENPHRKRKVYDEDA